MKKIKLDFPNASNDDASGLDKRRAQARRVNGKEYSDTGLGTA